MERIRKNAPLIIVALIIIVTAVFFCCSKQGFFLDEIYSHGLANSNYNPFIRDLLEDDIIDKTLTQEMMLDYVAIAAEDGFDYASVYHNQVEDVLPPVFYFLLHTVASFFPNVFSKWFGLGINLFFFCMTLVVLYKLINKLFADKYSAVIGIVLYGLSGLGLSTLLMLRMYMILTFFTVLLAYVILCLLDGSRSWYLYLLIAVTILAGLLTHYYYVFYAFFLCAAFDIYLVLRKKYKDVFLFSISALSGVACMFFVFPACINQLFGHERTGAPLLENLLNVKQYAEGIFTFGGVTVKNAFVVVLIGIISCLMLIVKRVKPGDIGNKYNVRALLVTVPACVTFILVAIIVARKNIRYVYGIIPILVIIVCYLLQLLFDKYKINYKRKLCITLFTLVMSLGMLAIVPPKYLYKEYAEINDVMEENKEYPCIYLSGNSNAPITSNLMQLMYFDEVFVTNSAGSSALEKYLEKYQDSEKLMVYIASYRAPYKMGTELETLCTKYGYNNKERLFQTEFSFIYMLSK